MLQPPLPLLACYKGRQKSWKRVRGCKERGELEYRHTYESHQAFRVCSNGRLSHGGTNNTVRKNFPWGNGGAYPWGKVDPRGKSPVLLCAFIFSYRVVHILFQGSGIFVCEWQFIWFLDIRNLCRCISLPIPDSLIDL